MKSHSVECENCHRRFLSDRLQVHMRSCRQQNGASKTRTTPPAQQKTSPQMPGNEEEQLRGDSLQTTPSPRRKRPIVICYICGREFGSKSIGIHEPQCLAKWRIENEKLPPHQRRPEPRKPGTGEQEEEGRHLLHPAEASHAMQSQTASGATTPRPVQSPSPGGRPPSVPCYLCGRQFGTKSIGIHEPQCLKKWHMENDKLPPEKRRPEPQKPDIVFKDDGQVDCEATFDAIWETHLQQLVPCKICGRTFFPERIQIHERSCKGNIKK